MSNTAASQRDMWAAFSKAWRERAGLSKTELGRQLGSDRGTVGRWERAETLPGSGAAVERFCDVTGAPRAEAFQAAGIVTADLPTPAAPDELEPAIDIINKSSLPAAIKAELIEEVRSQSEDDKRRRAEWVERHLRLSGRTGLNK